MRSEAASRSRGTGQRRRKDIAAPKTRDIRDVMRLWREREREEQERLSPGRGGNNVVEELLNEEELLDVLNVEYEELVTDTITSRPDKTVVHMTGISSPKSLNSLNYVDNADNSGRGGLSSSTIRPENNKKLVPDLHRKRKDRPEECEMPVRKKVYAPLRKEVKNEPEINPHPQAKIDLITNHFRFHSLAANTGGDSHAVRGTAVGGGRRGRWWKNSAECTCQN